MAGTEFSDEPVFKLKLLVDKEKNKVVLAEICKDFVDVLFSFLILPMGTIVRLLQKYQQNCRDCDIQQRFRVVYRAGSLTLGTRLKKMITGWCPNLEASDSCSRAYSNFCSLKCICGKFMEKEINTMEGCPKEIFGSGKKSFIILDNMEVGFCSIVLTLKALRGLGYTDLNKLDEMLVDVGHTEVLALLECLFSSDTPLMDVFLMKRSSCIITRTHNMPNLAVPACGKTKPNELPSVTVFVRKQDKKSLWKISGANIKLGCIGTFYKSMKSLSSSEGTTSVLTCTSMLPMNYNFQAPRLDVCRKDYSVSTESTVHGSSGFVRRGTTYMISDDLTISPTNSCSTIRILKKLNVGLDEIEEHVINISNTEV
ncbi:BnaC05g13600D [Brassica napus]|uniref:BnaC05g13600D protein n=1 Tax=Brassica napus TaxID=3708 RepID=A0A078IE76_BRANA|nr:BnaC05g13600D [Brassica napus]